jgi:hypothetical protein
MDINIQIEDNLYSMTPDELKNFLVKEKEYIQDIQHSTNNYTRTSDDTIDYEKRDQTPENEREKGNRIHITKAGRQELLASIHDATLLEKYRGPDGKIPKKMLDDSKAATRKIVGNVNSIVASISHLSDIIKNSKLSYKEDNYKKNQKSKQDRNVKWYEIYTTPVTITNIHGETKRKTCKIKVEFREIHTKDYGTDYKRDYYFHWFESQERNKIIMIPVISEFSFID